ncbi:MAG: LysR family transcriptional regulator, partial [Lachnospiraceae bacterium]|nr:LysR family transcriptional regulator [Lachnospiraceae bacterium]
MIDGKIQTFLTVCRYMNYTKASEELHITQPAVSQQIHGLEEYYHTKLFVQEGRKLLLTRAGEILYHASIALCQNDRMLKEELLHSEQKEGPLDFGATLTVGEYLMADRIETYLERHPFSKVRMVEGNTEKLLQQLKNDEIDFAIVEGNFKKSEFDFETFSRERYIPVMHMDYQCKNEIQRFSDLLDECLITREEGSGTRDILEKYMEAKNLSVFDFDQTVEIGGIQAIKTLVKRKIGITFVYEAAVKEEILSGEFVEIRLKDFVAFH